MDANTLSYVGALVAIFAFGTYMAPLKKWPDFSQYATLAALSWGAVLFSMIVATATGTWSFSIIGFICGIIWHWGGAYCFSAVRHESDLSGTSVRAMGACIIASFVSGLLIHPEQPLIIWLAIIAVLVLCGGLVILSPNFKGITKKWRSLLAGTIFGIQLVPYQIYNLSHDLSQLEFAFSYALGVAVGCHLLLKRYWKREQITFKGKLAPTIVAVLMGALWMAGTHGSFFAIASDGALGFAVGYPLSQLNLLVNIAVGVIVFGEYPGLKARLKLLAAAFVILAGAVLLTLAKIMAT